jgi:hypothetical protein
MQIAQRWICALGWRPRAVDTIGAAVCRPTETHRSRQPTALASLRQWRCGVPWLVGKSPLYFGSRRQSWKRDELTCQ